METLTLFEKLCEFKEHTLTENIIGDWNNYNQGYVDALTDCIKLVKEEEKKAKFDAVGREDTQALIQKDLLLD